MARRATPWNPNTASWLVSQRGTRKQDVVIADLAKRGVVITRTWLSRMENGAPFGQELLEAIQDYYGSVPPPYEPPASDTPAGGSLAEAILKLTAELEGNRRERTALQAQVDELSAMVKDLLARTTAIEAEHSAHPHSAGSGGR